MVTRRVLLFLEGLSVVEEEARFDMRRLGRVSDC